MHRFNSRALVGSRVSLCVYAQTVHVSCLSVFACAHLYEASSRVLCSSEKNHTSCSLPTPCQGQDPLTAPHCYFFMFVKCGVSMHMHTYTQMLSAVPIFSDTSHSQVRQSLSTRCRQPPLESAHSVSQSRLKTIDLLSN